jgi:hypothetical protein
MPGARGTRELSSVADIGPEAIALIGADPPPPPEFHELQAEVAMPEKPSATSATVRGPPPPTAPPALAPGMKVQVEYRGLPREFTLGEKLGEGVDATVFRLVTPGIAGCENGCVIKFYVKAPARALDVINDIENASVTLLTDQTGILQLKNRAYQALGPRPYIIQDELKLGEDLKVFKHGDLKNIDAETQAAFAADPGLRKAVVELFHKLSANGLAWEDAHLNNMFFKRESGKWTAGILDQDRIIKFSTRTEGRLGRWFADVEIVHMPLHCGSLADARSSGYKFLQDQWAKQKYGKPYAELAFHEADLFTAEEALKGNLGPYLPGADFFMEKMFEYKGYIKYDRKTKQFVDGLLKVDEIKELFPNLGQPDRAAPIDLTVPHWWKTSRLHERPAIDRQLRVAA